MEVFLKIFLINYCIASYVIKNIDNDVKLLKFY